MSQHLPHNLLERYQQRQVTPAELLTIGDHLLACETCRRQGSQVFSPAGPSAWAAILQTAAHLSEESLFLYAEGRLNAETRLATEAHLAECRQCRNDALDLRAHVIREELVMEEPMPVSRPDLAPVWSERWRAWWSQKTGWAGFPVRGLGVAALLLLAIGAGVFFFRAPEKMPLAQQQAQTQASPPMEAPDGYEALPTESDGGPVMGAETNKQTAHIQIFYQLEGNQVRLRWSPAPEVTEYDVSIHKADFSGQICRKKVKGLEFTCQPLPPGAYMVQVKPGTEQPATAVLPGKGLLRVSR